VIVTASSTGGVKALSTLLAHLPATFPAPIVAVQHRGVTASTVFGKDLVAVVLTGADADATDGAQSVKQHGGIVIAQDRATSQIFDMPRSAIETGCVDHVLPIERIAHALEDIVGPAQGARGTRAAQ
jgi:chemotaxis response regulator CheB